MSRAQLLTLKIELVESQPVIWRTFQLPDTVMLDEAGDLIQLVMGWEDCHLQAFHSGIPLESFHTDPRFRSWYDMFSIDELEGEAQEETTLAQALEYSAGELYYEYDFGDSWLHRITVEHAEELSYVPDAARALDGAMRAPIEDSGGLGGWYSKLADAAAPHPNEEQQETVAWMRWRVGENGTIDPNAFNLAEINARLATRGLEEHWNNVLARWLYSRPQLRRQFILDLASRGEVRPFSEPSALPDWFIARLVQPLLRLIALCGEKGVKLTQAGNLPSLAVSALVSDLGWESFDYSQGSRMVESNVVEVAELREAATAMRLVRKYHGRLIVTKKGRELSEKPEELAYLMIEQVSWVGNNQLEIDENFANWLTCVGVGDTSSPAARESLADVMNGLGYANGRTRMPLTAEDYVGFSSLAGFMRRVATAEMNSGYWEPESEQARVRARELARIILLSVVREPHGVLKTA
ncbi:plasmid pRiA4b ORF-3 family protein [Glutamicibacter uratoxydans]|uniref:plasmid pRiA4b ORF-3 family protein n=1 Tax=Glutamicibacter uratoxydans TaxID=43667 RepID=UPI003D7016B3